MHFLVTSLKLKLYEAKYRDNTDKTDEVRAIKQNIKTIELICNLIASHNYHDGVLIL